MSEDINVKETPGNIQDVSGANKMGTEPITKLILSMSIPAMISMIVQALYNIVDSIFVAMYSMDGLAAVSLAFPIQNLIIAVAVGTGVGVNSLISRLLGSGEQDKANSAATHGIVLALISWGVFALLGVFFSEAYISFFTNDKTVLELGTTYLFLTTVFSFAMFIGGVGPKILQATGDMIHPMTTQLLGAIVNIILDPIMIFGLFGFPEMGIAGAAIATIIGQIVSMIYLLYVIQVKDHDIEIKFKNFKFDVDLTKLIYIVGAPAIAMQAIGSVLVSGLNLILSAFSMAAVSVLGVYYKLQSFVFMPVFGLSQGSMPVMGYNYGAKNFERIKKALNVSTLLAIGIMALGTILFQFFPEFLLGLFNADAEMLDVGTRALRVISFNFVFAAVGIMNSTFFQAIGDGFKSMVVSLLRQLIILLPAAYILANYIGLDAFWYAFPISELVSICLSIFWMRSSLGKLEKQFTNKKTVEV